VIAMGVKPEDALSTELKKEIDKVFVVGDAGGIGKIAHAVQAGFKNSYELE